jgi:glycosyltransferase involved in cell wall biosynthesis
VPGLSLTLVGDGPTRGACEAQARRLGLDARIRFAGRHDTVAPFLRDADTFVLTSRSEACPNAVLEAMAMALPVVATDVGGIPELIEHRRTGFLVPPDRGDDIARAIVGLVRQPEFAQAIGRAARSTVASRFSFDAMVGRFEDLYDECLSRRAHDVIAQRVEPQAASYPSTRLR